MLSTNQQHEASSITAHAHTDQVRPPITTKQCAPFTPTLTWFNYVKPYVIPSITLYTLYMVTRSSRFLSLCPLVAAPLAYHPCICTSGRPHQSVQ